MIKYYILIYPSNIIASCFADFYTLIAKHPHTFKPDFTMKRKPDDSPESSSKMLRRDGDNSLNGGREAGHWEQRPGMILEVKMRNFMCHQVC